MPRSATLARLGALVLTIGVLVTTTLVSGHASTRVVVEVADVAEAIARGAIVWDVRDPRSYRQGHIPGAIQVGEPERVLRLPDIDETSEIALVERSFADAGLELDREIIVYATRGSPLAYAAQAAILYFGGTKPVVFHDGIEGWRESGRALEAGDIRRPPTRVKVVPNPAVAVTTDDVLARIGRPDVQIVDARTPAEYAGTDVRAVRAGHVPGAVNVPYEDNWVDPLTFPKLMRGLVSDSRGMALKPPQELRKLYAGLDPAKETIVYCQTGGRASETFGVLRHLGFTNVRLYKQSWSVYATRPDAPVVSGPAPGLR